MRTGWAKARIAHCKYRNNNHPDNRNDNIGFRVVVSHDSYTSLEMRLGFRTEPLVDSRSGSGPGRASRLSREAGRIEKRLALRSSVSPARAAPNSLLRSIPVRFVTHHLSQDTSFRYSTWMPSRLMKPSHS
jgi:hypothetical protein